MMISSDLLYRSCPGKTVLELVGSAKALKRRRERAVFTFGPSSSTTLPHHHTQHGNS